MTKILMINSDLAKNRGDRAITEGMIALIKERFPDADITGLSEKSTRDTAWFGSNFMHMDAQSLNPIDHIKLLSEARKSDFILWGGGELLKDYTNKFALWYWVLKILSLRVVNKNIFGTYQGIGPTNGRLSKKLICFIVKRCRQFVVRDHESYQKLINWGCSPKDIAEASDPAILPKAGRLQPATLELLKDTYDINDAFLRNFVAIGPRDWFHYKKGGLIPYKYRRKLGIEKKATETRQHALFISQLISLCDVVVQQGYHVLLTPMHMDEEDASLCELLRSRSASPEKVRILQQDTLSPAELRSVIGKAKAMVGLRLHSAIIATSAGVPALTYYYVDKGRAYFNQIGLDQYAAPIESLLDKDAKDQFSNQLKDLLSNAPAIQRAMGKKLSGMRQKIRSSFDDMMDLV